MEYKIRRAIQVKHTRLPKFHVDSKTNANIARTMLAFVLEFRNARAVFPKIEKKNEVAIVGSEPEKLLSRSMRKCNLFPLKKVNRLHLLRRYSGLTFNDQPK